MRLFDIEKVFRTDNDKRDNALSRVFGIFSEDIVRLWCQNANSKYEIRDGRPSLYALGGQYTNTTLDCALLNDVGDVFIGEQKCELAYQDYEFLELNASTQLDHHKNKQAFTRFLEMAENPQSYKVKVNGEEVAVKGSILIWGRVDDEKKGEIMEHFKLHDILSIEDMVNDLLEWNDGQYHECIERIRRWIGELMSSLNGQVP